MAHPKKGDNPLPGVRLGWDLAKSSFPGHGVEAHGKGGVRPPRRRRKVGPDFAPLPAGRSGREACGGAHDWARERPRLGHEGRWRAGARLPPERRGQQKDPDDAAAICAAGARPRTRGVPGKRAAPPAVRTGPRARELLGTAGTARAHQGRGLLLAYGLVLAPGMHRLRRTRPAVRVAAETLPTLGCAVGEEVRERGGEGDRGSAQSDPRSAQLATQHEAARRVRRVAGGGALTAPAGVATRGEGPAFAHGRPFAAGVGVGPRPPSTGGKTILGRSTQPGNVDLRPRWRPGARAGLQCSATRPAQKRRGVEGGRQRRGNTSAAVAVAATQARLLWALRARGPA